MSEDDDTPLVDWEAIKLKPITVAEKKKRKQSAMIKHRNMDQKAIKRQMAIIKRDMKSDLVKVNSFNNKGNKRGK